VKLKKIEISNFRNINDLEYTPAPGLNVFIGDNAQGKTNILEAIFVLATGNSFRTNNDRLMIQHEENSFNLKGFHLTEDRTISTEIDYHLNRGKQIKINSKKTTHNNQNRLRVVVFTPDDLYLVKGSPSRRRNYIDYILKEVSNEYRLSVDNYYKILRKRNELLKKSPINESTYSLLSELFIEYSAKIITARINFINLLDSLVAKNFSQLNQQAGTIKIKYALSFPHKDEKVNYKTLTENLIKHLEENKQNEIRRKNTLAGPHLDDINIYLNNKPARLFASQGQQRNIAVSLKISEVHAFKELSNFYPVFLLDEVLAEFDDQRKSSLLKQISSSEYQSFLTSVVNDMISSFEGKISIVKNGEIVRNS